MSEHIVKAPNVPPFVTFVTSAVPMVFDNSLSYYEALCALWKWLQDDVVNVINNNATVTEDYINLTNEYIEKFNELKTYVDTYFDNLDVQEEINNKLDEMAQDGSLGDIIEPYLQQFEEDINNTVDGLEDRVDAFDTTIGDLSDLETINKDSIVRAINSANLNTIEYFRRKYSNNYRPFINKGNVAYFDNVAVYKDIYNGNFIYDIDIDSYKHTGGSDIYVDPTSTESSSTQTGSLDHPFNAIYKAYNVAQTGDTIQLFGGVYYRTNTNFQSYYLDKSVNIVPYNNGNVILTNADALTYTQNATYSNVYQAARSNTRFCIDIRLKDKKIFPCLTKVDTLADCANTLDSYYIDSSNVYVNIGEEVTNDKIIFPLRTQAYMIRIVPNGANVKVFMDNITCIGGDYGIVSITGREDYDCEVIAKECNFLYSADDNCNAIDVRGANTIFYKCKACYGQRDGFNYHAYGTKICNSIELDCIGANNGLNSNTDINNGSTTHDGCKVMRINGIYFNNKGANVADINENTYSLNINCAAFDSKSEGAVKTKGDFVAQDSGITMDLYNCYSKGSKSLNNIYGVADTVINVHNCIYDNAASEGTLNID